MTTTQMTFGQLITKNVDEVVNNAQRQAIEKTLEMCMSKANMLGMQDFMNKQVTVDEVLEALKEGK